MYNLSSLTSAHAKSAFGNLPHLPSIFYFVLEFVEFVQGVKGRHVTDVHFPQFLDDVVIFYGVKQ